MNKEIRKTVVYAFIAGAGLTFFVMRLKLVYGDPFEDPDPSRWVWFLMGSVPIILLVTVIQKTLELQKEIEELKNVK